MSQSEEGAAMTIRTANDILPVVIHDLFQRTKSEKRAASIEAKERELPKICKILDLDPATLKPINN